MADTEKKSLLGGTDGASGYGAEEDPPPPYEPPAGTEDPQGAVNGQRPWWKPRRAERKLQRNPSLDKVEEDAEKEKTEQRKMTDYFGVRSYLHDFYDQRVYKDPQVYEDEDDFRYLLNPRMGRNRKCTSIWWKVFVWIGANFLIFGIIGVLVGYLVPQRPIFSSLTNNVEVVDNEAVAFNFNLDVCKLVGLILFCIGGLTLAAALLFPSFLYQYCDEDRREDSFKIHIGETEPLKSPVEMLVPAYSKVTEVQPHRKNNESVATKEGMVTYED